MTQQLVQYTVETLLVVIVGILGFGFKMVVAKMRASDNAVLHTIGELAYQQIEKNFAGTAGQDKLRFAIDEVRKRLDVHRLSSKVTDQQIIDAIQKGWYQNEGQYKDQTKTTSGT